MKLFRESLFLAVPAVAATLLSALTLGACAGSAEQREQRTGVSTEDTDNLFRGLKSK